MQHTGYDCRSNLLLRFGKEGRRLAGKVLRIEKEKMSVWEMAQNRTRLTVLVRTFQGLRR